MNPQSLKIKIAREMSDYEIVVGHDLIATSGRWARKCLGKGATKIVIVSNATVFKLYGKQTVASLIMAGFEVSYFLIKDGEAHKSLKTAEAAL